MATHTRTATTQKSAPEPMAAPRPQERLEYRLAMAFGFMSVIPILIVWTWAKVHEVDLSLVIYGIVGSATIGYFFITRKMVKSMIAVTEKAKAITSGQLTDRIEVSDHNEIGELARSFNRITQDLEQKISELELSREQVKNLLARIGLAINSSEGIDTLLNLIVENTAAALGAEMGSLMLVDGQKRELEVKTTWSKHGQAQEPAHRLKLGEGLPGVVARDGRAMRSSGDSTMLGFARNGHEPEGMILCVPLKLRDQPIGVVTVLRSTGTSHFTEDDESLLSSIGSQMAVAIENHRLNVDAEQTYLETIMALALAVEAKDPYSAGHSKRVGFYASQVAAEMGLDKEMQQTVNSAGILHDIGKIGIKDEILLKQERLTDEETKVMQQHSVIGEAIVRPVRALKKVVALVRGHHEKYDGSGYPGGLQGEAIPLGARILAVADTYDAMITDRPYRKRLSLDAAKAELTRSAGTHLDPQCVEAFLRLLEQRGQRLDASASSPAA